MTGGHAGTGHDQILRTKIRNKVPAKSERAADFAQFLYGIAKLLLAAVVNCSHLSATRGAEARRGDSCSRESYDQHAFAIEFDSGMHPYLSFSVVSEKSAKTSATIQKRTMIFDSLQPASSK